MLTRLRSSLLLALLPILAASPQAGREVEVTYVGDLTETEHNVGGKVGVQSNKMYYYCNEKCTRYCYKRLYHVDSGVHPGPGHAGH